MTWKTALMVTLAAAAAIPMAACSDDDSSGDQAGVATVAPADMNFANPLVVYEATVGDSDVVDIYIIDPANGDFARLTDGESFNAGPAWSPDRQRIVFSSTRDGQDETDVYSMARDGTDIRRITDTPEAEYEPRISPDGQSMAFVRQDGSDWILSIMDVDGSNIRDLTEPMKYIEFPAWRPDGSLIAFAGIVPDGSESDLFAVSPDGGERTTLIQTDTSDVCPHFTVDGATLLYATIPEGEDQLDIFAHDMENTDTSTASDTRLTDHPEKDDYGEPGPDGRVVFVSHRDGNPELYIMNPDGSGQERLTTTRELEENLPDW
jgi:TolB protein